MSDVGENRPRPTAEESEGVFRAIFEQDVVGVAQVASETGDFVRINRRYAEIVGYTVAEMEQLTFQQITHPEDLQEDLANMQRLLAGETREFSMVKRYYHKDGSIVWINLTVSPMWEVGEEPTFHIAVVEDVTERKRGESALQEARDFAEHLIETANAMVVVLDTKGEIRVFNSTAERITGYTKEEIADRNWFEVLVPRERYPEVWAEFERLMDGGIPLEFENPILTTDGEERHIVWKSNELIRNGEIVGLVSFGIDITERKRTEEALRDREERLRVLFEQAADAIYVSELDGRLIQVNQEACRSTGYTERELLGLNVTDIDAETGTFEEQRSFFESLSSDSTTRIESLHQRKDGSAFPVETTIARLEAPDGDRILGIARDITERKRAEDGLRESEGRLREALRMAHLGNWHWNVQTGDVAWSEEVYEIYRLDPKEFTPHIDSIQAFSPWPGDRDRHLELIQRAIEDHQQGFYEQKILRADGTVGCCLSTFQGIYDVEGRLAAMRGTVQDITDRKQAEREREELITRLEAQNAELERFTYTVSHDLKSPLITIKGYIGMLFEDLQESEAESIKSDLIRISNAADKMGDLLSDLLELSRIGRLVNAPEDVPLDELAHEALQLVRGQMELRSVQVEVFSGLPVVRGDRTRLLEVLQNLIDNAAKYMGDEAHPRVEIGARQDKGEVVCYVRDNGIGIERRFHEKVFGLFDQLDPKVEGTGIGLALVRRIVEVHGGRIWIESEGQGRGSTFCFTIPAGPSPTTERSIEPESRG